MKLYTEEQVLKIIQKSVIDKPETYYEVLKDYTPIELPDNLNTFKKIIEDRPAEFSQYNAYTLLFVIDLIQNGKEVPGQTELIKMIRQGKLNIKDDGKVGLSNPDETTNNKLAINK